MGTECDECGSIEEDENRRLIANIREKQRRFVGHVLREDDGMERNRAELVGKRARGRQRMKMFNWMKKRLNLSG